MKVFNHIMITMLQLYIDEAGRGPLAGPVYVGLVYCLPGCDMHMYGDSKSFSAKKRDMLYQQIVADKNIVSNVGYASNKVIDRYGIVYALQQSVCKALFSFLQHQLGSMTLRYSRQNLIDLLHQYDDIQLVIDGNHDFGLERLLGLSCETIIKGDALVPEIGMASILAKVSRDREMQRYDKKYVVYGFATHKGYGTSVHRQAIKQYGLSDIHRKSFCKNLI